MLVSKFFGGITTTMTDSMSTISNEILYLNHDLITWIRNELNVQPIDIHNFEYGWILRLNDNELNQYLNQVFLQQQHEFIRYNNGTFDGKLIVSFDGNMLHYVYEPYNMEYSHKTKNAIPLSDINRITMSTPQISPLLALIHLNYGNPLHISCPNDPTKLRIFAAYLEALRNHYKSIDDTARNTGNHTLSIVKFSFVFFAIENNHT